MMLRLDPPIPLWTPKGEGLAHFIIDYGLHEHHIIWGVCLYEGGGWWWLENTEVRGMSNQTIGREKDKPFDGGHTMSFACTCGLNQAFCGELYGSCPMQGHQ